MDSGHPRTAQRGPDPSGDGATLGWCSVRSPPPERWRPGGAAAGSPVQVRRLFPGVHLPSTSPLTSPVLVDGARPLLPPDALATSTTALRLAGVPVGALHPLRPVTAHPHQG